MTTTTLVLYYTKGLADVALAEIADVAPAAAVIEHTDRFAIVAVSQADHAKVRRGCRTVDDIRTLVAGPAHLTSDADLAALCEEAAATAAPLAAGDGRGETPQWSVTVSARNPAWRRGSEWDPATTIAKHLRGADTGGTSRAPVDLRLQVDEDRAHVAVNFPARRADATIARRGALRATVAAAIVRLAASEAGNSLRSHGVYDAFCGSGTLLAEAAAMSLPVFGSDIDDGAVRLTRERLRSRLDVDSLAHRVFVHDVVKGFPARVSARVLVGNMPWGKQIKIARHQELFDATAQLVAHVVDRGGVAALLTTNEDRFVARIRRQVKDADIDTRRIGLLGQTPAIVIVRS